MNTRRNPFEEIEQLFERMSRQFDEASRMWESNGPFGQWWSETESMAVDLVDHNDEFVMTVDLPGYKRDNVEIRVSDHTLRIEAERDEELEEQDERYLRQERRHESIQRSLKLPEEVDKEAVTARMNNGVLTITLPKLEVTDAQEIEIDAE